MDTLHDLSLMSEILLRIELIVHKPAISLARRWNELLREVWMSELSAVRRKTGANLKHEDRRD